MGGSMGSVVGEKITRLIEYAPCARMTRTNLEMVQKKFCHFFFPSLFYLSCSVQVCSFLFFFIWLFIFSLFNFVFRVLFFEFWNWEWLGMYVCILITVIPSNQSIRCNSCFDDLGLNFIMCFFLVLDRCLLNQWTQHTTLIPATWFQPPKLCLNDFSPDPLVRGWIS